jgi:hypothetical protein
MTTFTPGGLPLLIGSLPMDDHTAATRLIFDHTPEIPLWPQLPCYPEEGMIPQFLPGMPGVVQQGDGVCIDPRSGDFEKASLVFYEQWLAVTEGDRDLLDAFALTAETGRGFFAFTDYLDRLPEMPTALKGQVTGPFTFTTGVKDADDRSIFYNEQLRDLAVKLIALKAAWQTRRLKRYGCPAIMFIDEPALAGFGTSEFISVGKEEVSTCLAEVIDAIHREKGLAGIHVCANTDWSLLLESEVDIINFDAYAYFDRFILYAERIASFLDRGGILAWGIVPTLEPEDIDRENVDSLAAKWESQAAGLEKAGGGDRKAVLDRSLITPSCGTGSLDLEHATRVLHLTQEVSRRVRSV